MDSIAGTRAQQFAAVERAIEHGQRVWRDRQSGQAGLFAGVIDEAQAEPPLPEVPEWSDKEKLAGEKEMLGFYVTGHPLDEYRDKIAELATHDSRQPRGSREGRRRWRSAACSARCVRKRNKEGKPWADGPDRGSAGIRRGHGLRYLL